jgi:hypothetical protein
MILYKKSFPLGEGISFFGYIKALEKKRFPNYYLRIEKIPSTTNYHATMVFTVPNWEWGLRGPFIDGVLLKDCTIQYSEGERYFTLQASPKATNLFFASLSGHIFNFLRCCIFYNNDQGYYVSQRNVYLRNSRNFFPNPLDIDIPSR